MLELLPQAENFLGYSNSLELLLPPHHHSFTPLLYVPLQTLKSHHSNKNPLTRMSAHKPPSPSSRPTAPIFPFSPRTQQKPLPPNYKATARKYDPHFPRPPHFPFLSHFSLPALPSTIF